MVENPFLIRQKLIELNEDGGDWEVLAGYNAITSVEYLPEGLSFKPNFGYPVKVFYSRKTGEMRFFDAKRFLT